MPLIRDDYYRLAAAWEGEFARNRALHGARIQCRSGCDACCSQLFQITEPEAAVISQAISALPPTERATLQARAQTYLARRAELYSQHGLTETWGVLPPEGTRLACPALENGACLIYEHRPLICRKFGIPLYNPDRPAHIQACELNFRPGDEINDGRLVQIQTALHNDWKSAQARYNNAGGHRDPQPVTIARAIGEDFSSCIGPNP